ncbi:hypothetical protein BDQ17DRAFT_1256344 [Cyathus striatus]|nr:hypothetical protein BDQ17DRAFT_1256344 [Cyathus striatus]
MPHKRSKRSIREQEQKKTGSDHAPTKSSLNSEAMPKSAARIFNATQIREDYKKRKRECEEGGQDGKRRKTDGDGQKNKVKPVQLKIQPGESIQHFNKRVEDDMRPLVRSAAQVAKATKRIAIREELKLQKENKKGKKNAGKSVKEAAREPSPPPVPTPSKHANSVKEFATLSSSAPRRLNDIAQAPPEFKKLPRGATANSTGKHEGVLSMAQKSMMEKEREKAIARYRELKASRRKDDGMDKE